MSIDPKTSIGAVHLTVRDLPRLQAFYEERLGFATRDQQKGVARLGPAGKNGKDLLVLHENRTARIAHDTAGLFHFAVLVPSRPELAESLIRLARTRTMLQGASDHGVSEALYLADPEGNGIEIYRDRPRAEWPMAGGKLQMGTYRLDLDDLLTDATGDGTAPIPAGTVIGHMHLQVSQIQPAEQFYLSTVGFDLMVRYGTQASFVSAGGYHHHLGFNTWQSLGAPAAPPDAAGLRYFEVALPSEDAREETVERLQASGAAVSQSDEGPLVRDPSGNALVLTIA